MINTYYDFLDKYVKMGAARGYEICMKQESMNAEEIWMRDPLLQSREELTFYDEIFEFVIRGFRANKERKHYQIFHYKKRAYLFL